MRTPLLAQHCVVALLKCETVAYLHMYGKKLSCQVVTFSSQFSQHMTFKQSRRDDGYAYLCNLLPNLLWVMHLALVKSLYSTICHLDSEFSRIKCGLIPHFITRQNLHYIPTLVHDPLFLTRE